MRELKKMDDVAYIRFASVYEDFQRVDDFRDAILEVEETRHQARAPYREVMFTAADHGFMEQALRTCRARPQHDEHPIHASAASSSGTDGRRHGLA